VSVGAHVSPRAATTSGGTTITITASGHKPNMSSGGGAGLDAFQSRDELLALKAGALPNSTLDLTPTGAQHTPQGGHHAGASSGGGEFKSDRVIVSSSQYMTPSPSEPVQGRSAGADSDGSTGPSPFPLDSNAPAAAEPPQDGPKSRCSACLADTRLWLLWALDTVMFHVLTAYDQTVAYCAGGGYRPKRRKRMNEKVETEVRCVHARHMSIIEHC